MNTIALAFRNLLRQKRRTIFLASAVALGFAVMTLLSALSGGMVGSLKENLSQSFGGHVFLKAKEWNQYDRVVTRTRNVELVPQALEALGRQVASYSRRSEVTTQLVFGSKTLETNLTGVEWERETFFRKSLTASSGSIPAVLEANQLLLNTVTAKTLGAQAGDELLVKFKTLDGQQNLLDFTVAAVIDTAGGGGFTQDSFVLLSQANDMLGLAPGEFQTLNLLLKDMNQQEKVGQQLEAFLLGQQNTVKIRIPAAPDENPLTKMMDAFLGTDSDSERWEGPRYEVSILDDFTSTFLSLVAVIQAVSYVIFAIMLVVTLIGISNTFRMILQERTVEIGTLRALGMRRRGIMKLFLWEAVAVLTLGVTLGGALAVTLALVLGSIPLTGMDFFQIFLTDERLLFQPGLTPTLTTILVVLGVGLLAASSPARKAARLFPADALRHRG